MEIKKQQDVRECGLMIIQAFHHFYHKKWLDINKLKIEVNFGKKGINVDQLIQLGTKHGLKLEAYKTNVNQIIKEEIKNWLIGLINIGDEMHYVIFRIGKTVEIHDSVNGHHKMTIDNFTQIFSGVILTCEKLKLTTTKNVNGNNFSFVSDHFGMCCGIMLLLLVITSLSLVSSIFMKEIIDNVIPGQLHNMLFLLTICFCFIVLVRVVTRLFKNTLVKKFAFTIERQITFLYISKLRNAPYTKLTKLTFEDQVRRMGGIKGVADYFAMITFTIFNDVLMLTISAGILAWIDIQLFIVSSIIGFIIMVVSLIFQLWYREMTEKVMNLKLAMLKNQIDIVRSIRELKTPLVGHNISDRFSKSFNNDYRNDFNIWTKSVFNRGISLFFELATPLILTFLATQKVFDNKITIGMMILFISMSSNFIFPLTSLSETLIAIGPNRKMIKLIEFVLNLEDEEKNINGLKEKIQQLEFQNYSFGYDNPIFKRLNLKINSHTQLTGQNGSGKTTLLKIISTLLSGSGNYLINNKKIEYHSLEHIRQKTIYISQDGYLPTMTIWEYITDNNYENISILKKNLEKYNLTQIISESNLFLNNIIEGNGQNFSSGQRQIIMILKIFASNYDLVLLDEAFENIDAEKFQKLKKSLESMQTIFIETSHSRRWIFSNNEVNVETALS